MITINKLDNSFGPVGTIAGVTLFLVGIILIFFSLSGLALILIGAFVGFTYSSTLVDIDNKRVRFSNNLFGVIKTGNWVNIEPTMNIVIEPSKRTWRAYSRSSRSIDITDKDFRLILYNSDHKLIMPLMKIGSLESAKNELESLKTRLHLNQK